MKNNVDAVEASSINGEPLLTYLMPISLLIFVICRVSHAELLFEHILLFSCYQWTLSLKNVIFGPLKKDSGFILWALVALSAYMKTRTFALVMASIVGLANGVVGLYIVKNKPWNNNYTRTARYLRKSVFFAKTFTMYTLSAGIFWLWIAHQIYHAPEELFLIK